MNRSQRSWRPRARGGDGGEGGRGGPYDPGLQTSIFRHSDRAIKHRVRNIVPPISRLSPSRPRPWPVLVPATVAEGGWLGPTPTRFIAPGGQGRAGALAGEGAKAGEGETRQRAPTKKDMICTVLKAGLLEDLRLMAPLRCCWSV